MSENYIIGGSEGKRSASFLKRKKEKIHRHNLKEISPTKFFAYEWAEYKTSVLMVLLYEDTKITFDLKLFMHKMIMNITSLLMLDLQDELVKYMSELTEGKQKEKTSKYPVAQSQVWIKNENTAGLWNDVYGLINFAKWLWEKIYKGDYYHTYYCDEVSLNYNLMVMIFQQQMFKVQTSIKGDRSNTKKFSDKDSTPYVGISPFKNSLLKKRVNSVPDAIIVPWMHPGSKQCFVPYFGGYGGMLKSYRDSEDPAINAYSSLQCGISGSVNYFTFLYLLSTNLVYDKNIQKNLYRLILTISLQLAGDGGHNMREIIFGMTTIAIIIYHMISDIKDELRNHYGRALFLDNIEAFKNDPNTSWAADGNGILNLLIKQYLGENGIDTKLNNCMDVNNFNVENTRKKLFTTMLNSLVNWEKSIVPLYQLTGAINVVGIDQQDLFTYGIPIDNETFSSCKREAFQIFFNQKDVNIKDSDQVNRMQIFFALDNNRFMLNKENSFKKSPDVLLSQILNELYPGLLETVNNKVEEKFLKFYKVNPSIHIPFA